MSGWRPQPVPSRWSLAVRDDETLEAVTKHVALTLATYMNRSGEAWPSVDKLAKAASRADRTIQRHLPELVERGYLAIVEKGGGRRRTTTYAAIFPTETATGGHPFRAQRVTLATRSGDSRDEKGCQRVARTTKELERELVDRPALSGRPVDAQRDRARRYVATAGRHLATGDELRDYLRRKYPALSDDDVDKLVHEAEVGG